jgi:inward rectifier potassium channel
VVGAASHPIRDAYHALLTVTWPRALAAIGGAFLFLNALFAMAFFSCGGVGGAREGSFRDAFFFSVQTMGTIGYGAMYAQSDAANVIVVAETVVGLIFTALATGLVFARFSRTRGELVFSRNVCISPIDGVPTLTFRVGNDRASAIFEARVTVVVIRTEITKEGVLLYRLYDAELVRSQTQALQRSFMVMHRITEGSPLFGATPESMIRDEVEITVSVVGTDDTSLQPVHMRKRYEEKNVLWGARLADILSERPDGRLELDVRRFHDTEPTEPTAAFPYPRTST